MTDTEPPIIAHRRPLAQWNPQLGDYVVRSGWFQVAHGLVNSVNREGTFVDVVFAGTPGLLLGLAQDEMAAASELVSVIDIRNKRKASWAVLQHDPKSNSVIWYI